MLFFSANFLFYSKKIQFLKIDADYRLALPDEIRI